MAMIQKSKRLEIKASRTDWHENQKGKQGIIFCALCNAVYYKKSWHHNLRYYKNLHEDLKVSFATCPACTAIKNNEFEGRLIISNVPKNITEHLENLVHAFTHRAYQKDPMDRLIAMKKTNGTMEITTTENQLAVKLAKKIGEVFKKATIKISYSHSKKDKAVDIRMEFLA
ncbi:MAG: NMD3-related protein [Candidatus Azambacteria bacterium]|nr:NMD3-related protein [Candidatus Azambacteria bacterium]